jgi:hypothetical protein
MDEAYKELGVVQYEHLEVQQYMEELQLYHAGIIQKITELKNGNNKGLDTNDGFDRNPRKSPTHTILAD